MTLNRFRGQGAPHGRLIIILRLIDLGVRGHLTDANFLALKNHFFTDPFKNIRDLKKYMKFVHMTLKHFGVRGTHRTLNYYMTLNRFRGQGAPPRTVTHMTIKKVMYSVVSRSVLMIICSV